MLIEKAGINARLFCYYEYFGSMTFCIGKACDYKMRLLQYSRHRDAFVLQTTSGFCIVLFALMQKEPKKSRQNPIAPRVFALPTPPHV